MVERHVFQNAGQLLTASKTGIEIYQIVNSGDYLKVALRILVVRYRAGALQISVPRLWSVCDLVRKSVELEKRAEILEPHP